LIVLGAFGWYTYEVPWIFRVRVQILLGAFALSVVFAVWLCALYKFSLRPVLAVLVVLLLGHFWALFAVLTLAAWTIGGVGP
jgi:Trk-type K+ transport system membrane component